MKVVHDDDQVEGVGLEEGLTAFEIDDPRLESKDRGARPPASVRR